MRVGVIVALWQCRSHCKPKDLSCHNLQANALSVYQYMAYPQVHAPGRNMAAHGLHWNEERLHPVSSCQLTCYNVETEKQLARGHSTGAKQAAAISSSPLAAKPAAVK